jgi:hypothetical protein
MVGVELLMSRRSTVNGLHARTASWSGRPLPDARDSELGAVGEERAEERDDAAVQGWRRGASWRRS